MLGKQPLANVVDAENLPDRLGHQACVQAAGRGGGGRCRLRLDHGREEGGVGGRSGSAPSRRVLYVIHIFHGGR